MRAERRVGAGILRCVRVCVRVAGNLACAASHVWGEGRAGGACMEGLVKGGRGARGSRVRVRAVRGGGVGDLLLRCVRVRVRVRLVGDLWSAMECGLPAFALSVLTGSG